MIKTIVTMSGGLRGITCEGFFRAQKKAEDAAHYNGRLFPGQKDPADTRSGSGKSLRLQNGPVLQDEERLRVGNGFHQVQPGICAQQEAGGAQGIPLRGGVGKDRHLSQVRPRRIAGKGVEDVMIPDPVFLEAPFVGAGGDQGAIVEGEDAKSVIAGSAWPADPSRQSVRPGLCAHGQHVSAQVDEGGREPFLQKELF